jgi:hypothetical protein
MSGREESVDERQERLGRNEALFRVVNERVAGLNEAFAVITGDFEIVCECGDATCIQQIVIPTDAYARIRSDPTLFVLAPGHQDATAEAVVDEHDSTYVVVRKHPGGPADYAAETAPD